jgi:PAS domain S-box-containing protein
MFASIQTKDAAPSGHRHTANWQGPKLLHLIAGLAFFVVSVIAVTSWVIQQEQKDYLNEVDEKLALVSRFKAEQIMQWRQERLRDGLSIMAGESIMEQLIDWMDGNVPVKTQWNLTHWLQSIRFFYDYEDTLVVHADGTVLFSTFAPFEERLPVIPEPLLECMRDRKVSLISLSTQQDHPRQLLCLAIPLHSRLEEEEAGNRPDGALLLTINPITHIAPILLESDYFQDVGRSWLAELSGSGFLFWGSERTLQPSDPMLPLAPFLDSSNTEPANLILSGENAIGIPFRGWAMRLPDTSWFLVSAIPKNIIRSDIRRNQFQIALIGISLIFIAAGGVFIYHRTHKIRYYRRQIEWQKDRAEMARKLFESQHERKRLEKHLENQRLQLIALFDGIDDNIYVARPETHELLYINYPLQKICRSDWRHHKCYEVIFNRESPCDFCTNDIIFGSDSSSSVSWEYQLPGRQEWYRCVDKAIAWIDGSMVKFQIASDITGLKTALDAVRQSETKYRLLVENIPQKIFVKDKNSIYLSINRNFARDVNIKPEDIPGKTDMDLFPREFSEKYRKDDRHVLATGETLDMEEKCFLNNRETWIHTVKTPLKDDQGNVSGILGIFWDISEQKQAEDERRRLMQELERKTREQSQMIHVASHDLRSPVVNIQGFSHELVYSLESIRKELDTMEIPPEKWKAISTILDEEIPEALHFIENSTRHIDRLISGILKFYRIGSLQMESGYIDMNAIIQEVRQNLQFQVTDKQINMKTGDLPPCIGDAAQISQVFLNLVGNAIKYQSDRDDRSVVVSGWRENGSSIYCIEDNGVGIPQQNVSGIFDLFQRLDPNRAEGEGIGLTIVRTIVDRHNGQIWVESEEGVGSKFFVSLPFNNGRNF